MSHMTVLPEFLGNAEQDAEVCGKNFVPVGSSKKRKMNEIMGDRIRVPPDAETDQQNWGNEQQQTSVHGRQCDEESVPV
jgi:hypothetical protein